MTHSFKPLHIDALRMQARKYIEQDAVTATYTADRPEVLRMLDESRAPKSVCMLRYHRHRHRDLRRMHTTTSNFTKKEKS